MLQEQDKLKLDGIVKQMIANKESDDNIQLVVNDFKQKYSKQANIPQDVVQENTNNPTFAYTGSETPLQAGLKAAGNIPSSAYNLGKGLVSAITNPVETVKSIGSIAKGGIQKLTPGIQESEESFNTFAQMLKNRYGSLDSLAKTAIEDPFGFGADVLSLVGGGASLIGKTAQFGKGVSTIGKLATSPVGKGIEKVTDFVSPLVSKTSKYVTSQATGLNPETITELIKNPNAFKNVTPENRIQTANAVKDALDSRLSELGGLGKEYQVLRDTSQVVTIPPNTIKGVLNKYGVKLDDNNQIITSAESRPLSPGDRNALQDFINNYGKEQVLSSNAFLNTREALSNLAKYDSSKTNISTTIARDLRSAYDEVGKMQIKGLKELDTQYAPERQLLSQIKSDILDSKTGELKDGAVSKIANITGKGKENLLNRMKEIVPDIEQRVKVIKAVEDIERTMGQKTGTYIKGAITGSGVLTGNVPIIVASIIAQPQIAVPLLKGAGYVGQKAVPIINALKSIANDINNFRLPSQFIDSDTGQLKAGLSTKDVTNIRLTAPIKDAISKELASYDTKPLTIVKNNSKFALPDDTRDMRLEELQKKLRTKSLNDQEYKEAYGLLLAKGMKPLNNL